MIDIKFFWLHKSDEEGKRQLRRVYGIRLVSRALMFNVFHLRVVL